MSEVPTPWMCLQQDLRDQGIDPGDVSRLPDRAMALNHQALQAGDILYAASTRGPTAYTAFIATRAACDRYHDEFAAMVRATATTVDWLYASPAEELAAAVASFFTDGPDDILTGSVRRYKDAGIRSRGTMLNPQDFARLGQSLHSGGLISRLPSYEQCVDLTLNALC